MIAFVLLLLTVTPLFATGITYNPIRSEEYHELYEEVSSSSPLLDEEPAIFDIKSSLFKDTTIIDFEKRQISFIRYDTLTGIPVWQYHYPEINEYFNDMRRALLLSLWNERWKKKDEEVKDKKEGSIFQLTAPDFYPPWAIRILGKEPPKLSIKGFQSITLALRGSKTEIGTNEEGNERIRPRFHFDYDNMFTIRGSIGRLISIELKTGKNKEGDDFSFKDELKKLKIEYRAHPDSADQLEDEIVQEIVAGYTNFQMPGQGLAGFSGSHEGLFGIKVRSQIGPLALTTIVSKENAETQKKELDPTGKTSGQTIIGEADYLRNVFFFLDSIYLQKYIGEVADAPFVKELYVYQHQSNFNFNVDDPQNYKWALYKEGINRADRFKILKEHDDYKIDRVNGWIQFLTSRPGNTDIIAIYMILEDQKSGIIDTLGDLTLVADDDGELAFRHLRMLKNKEPDSKDPTDSLYYLMWRNVYTLPSNAQPDNFKIEIIRQTQDAKGEKYRNPDSLFSYILGVTNKEGNPDVGNNYLFDFENKLLIIPPFVYGTGATIIRSNHPFENPNLGALANGESNINKNIYYDSSTSEKSSKYQIVMTGSSRQTSFNIGFGIIPGSETLKTHTDKVLVKDKDYIIDYEFGQVTLISDLAQSATKIEVEFQQESLFMFESRTFLGAYGKLDLPFIGRDSYFASTVMGQFTSSRDKIPRVGHEPFNRFLFDANLRLDFEPEWMTSFVNFIPFVSTTSPSSATFDFEIAYSYLSPDKDQGGEAYIDNFQSSERGYPLGESHLLWYQASPAKEWIADSMSFLYNPPAWRSYWYSPVKGDNRTRREEIWKFENEDDQAEQDEYLTTLRLHCQPLPDDTTLLPLVSDASGILVNPWSGIMTPIPSSLQDRRKDRYFEFWVKNKFKRGILHIDMGEVREDISLSGGLPNSIQNRENYNTSQGEYDEKYDLGLDGLADSNEIYYFPDLQSVPPRFDSLKYKDPRLGIFAMDPSRDNYMKYDAENKGNRDKVNGTQNDKYLTSEDLNGDASFSLRDNYFRIEIDFANLDSNLVDWEKMTDSAIHYGWYPIRIPLNIPGDTIHIHDTIGRPKWDNIQYVRFLWSQFQGESDLTRDNMIEFTEIKFTGNQWQEVVAEDSSSAKIIPSVLNTIDDKGFYDRPTGIDPYDNQGNVKKDYALRLEYENIPGGQAALVKRDIPSFQKIDISSYDEIRMYIKDTLTGIYKTPEKKVNLINHPTMSIQDLSVEFIFRFGNSDSSYYQYKTANTKNRWVKDRDLRINLKKLSQMKQDYHNIYGYSLDSINIIDTLSDGSTLQIFSKTGVLPIFSDIRWMALGMVRDSNASGYAEGELWIHGLRVKGLKAKDGWAFRANLNTHWADFMDISANLSYDDAEFRKMSENAQLTKDAEIQAGINGQLSFNKFLPEKLGITIPIGTGISASLARPKMRPGSDIFLTKNNGRADRFADMAKDFADLIFTGLNSSSSKTAAEHYEKNKISKSWYTSYSKSAQSENPLVNLTVDRITTSYNFSKDSTTEREGFIPAEDRKKLTRSSLGEDHINVTAMRTHNSSLKYDLSPRKPPKWTSWTPFKKVEAKKFPRYIRNYSFELLPKSFHFDLADGTFSKNYTYRSLDDIASAITTEREVENLEVSHGFQYAYSPISPLMTFNYDIKLNRNFDQALAEWNKQGSAYEFFKRRILSRDYIWKDYYITYGENARNQNVSINIDPQIFDWLTHSGDYRVAYSQNPRTLNNIPGYLKSHVTSNFNFSSNFRIRSFFTAMGETIDTGKGMSKTFIGIEKGLEKIGMNSINFNYKASLDLNNDYWDTEYLAHRNIYFFDFFKYQLGLKNRDLGDILTGNMDDWKAFGGVRSRYGSNYLLYRGDSRSTSQDYTISTSLRIPKPLDIQFNSISLSWKRTYKVLPDTLVLDTVITFPEFRVGASSSILQKIPFINKSMKRMDLSSTYRLLKTVRKNYYGIDNRIREDVTLGHGWEPLVSVNGQIKKRPINVDYTFNFTSDQSESRDSDTGKIAYSGSETKTFTNIWNAGYEIPGKSDRELKIFNRWTIPIKGNLNMSMNITHNATHRKHDEKGEEEDWSFIIHPKVTYDFTDYVDGLLEYIYEKSYTGLTKAKKTSNELALTLKLYLK